MTMRYLKFVATEVDDVTTCLFDDILSRLSPDAKAAIDRCLPRSGASNEEAADCYAQMYDHLRENAAKYFPKGAVCYCQVHKRMCEVIPRRLVIPSIPKPKKIKRMVDSQPHEWSNNRGSDDDDDDTHHERPLTVVAAGNTCVGWSLAGLNRRAADPSEVPHNVWRAERAMQHEDVFYQECVQPYPTDKKLVEALSSTHDVLFMRIGPDDLGFPVRRPRSYSFGINRATCRWVGPADYETDFKERFFRSLQCEGDVFFCAPVNIAANDLRCRACARGVYFHEMDDSSVVQVGVPGSPQDFLPPGAVQRFHAWGAERSRLQSMTGTFISDIDHWPGRGSVGGCLFPALQTHGSIYSWTQGRFATPGEHLVAQGFPLYPSRPAELSALTSALRLTRQSTESIKRLAGNGMHLAVLSSWVWYCLSNTVRIDSPMHISAPHSFGLDEIEDSWDGGDAKKDDGEDGEDASAVVVDP